MPDLHHEAAQKTVQDFVSLYEDGHLELSPVFQRDSVWTERDRAKLIDSIMRNYPLPAIFLYRRHENGELIYDVIDGKQRIESILMFMGVIRGGRFWAKLQLSEEDGMDWHNWRTICRKKLQHRVTGYNLRIIEVDGELADIIDLFVRINSTGKALTPAEKRKARYYNSDFLKEAAKLADKYESYFVDNGILSSGQITRMKHVELTCEIMVSIYQGDVINKKRALDHVMKTGSISWKETRKCKARTVTTLNRIKRIFPQLYRTRFCKLSDFYTLVVLIAKFETEGMILSDRQRNKLAWDLLVAFSNGVDNVRLRQKSALGVDAGQELHRDYLLTVLEATDEISQRRKREQILRGLLQSLFESKDAKRLFTKEQRRILWNTTAERACDVCHAKLTWEDFTIDHIDPYSKGGRTALENAAILCRKHNSSKGNRRRRRHAA